MALLTILLPTDPSAPHFYAASPDGAAVATSGAVQPQLLPPAGRGTEVVAVVPASVLSWHAVELPRGVNARSSRLRPVLVGLLEERLLDAPETLHFAIAPETGADGRTWVATCDRAWLRAQLQTLDAAGRPATRIVPELDPDLDPPQLWFCGTTDQPELLIGGRGVPGGVQALPATRAALELVHGPMDAEDLERHAEPAVAAQAHELLGSTDVALGQRGARLLDASRSRWNLAQLEFARGGSAWAMRRASAALVNVLRAPRWRAVRWGAALLVAIQVVGLNWAAHDARQALRVQQTERTRLLTQTFPETRVVVDAPLQMARAMAALRLRSGAIGPEDLESMLAALAGGEGAIEHQPTALHFTSGTLRLDGARLAAHGAEQLRTDLANRGYALTETASGLEIRTRGGGS